MPPLQNSEPSNTLDPPKATTKPDGGVVDPLATTLQGRSSKSGVSKIVLLVFLLVCVVVIGLLLANQQRITDWWRLRGYQPPATISQFVTQDTMNSYTQHLFYLNKPQLLSTVGSFRQDCPENENTIVLGCYHPDQNGIYIYKVQDPTLAGVQQVTAAHEVLHSVYARLSTKERNYVDGLLENYYQHGLTDPRVKAEVKLYQQTEPHSVMDEMHSTFGTEIANLPAPLEAYYKQFFTNRAAIVAYEQKYQGAFTTRQNTVTSDDQQLTAIQRQINSQQAALSAELAQINADRTRLGGLLSSGQNAAYNAAVPGFNNEVDTYNGDVQNLQNTITSYNQLVTARNLVAGELTTLDKALDTRQTPKTIH